MIGMIRCKDKTKVSGFRTLYWMTLEMRSSCPCIHTRIKCLESCLRVGKGSSGGYVNIDIHNPPLLCIANAYDYDYDQPIY